MRARRALVAGSRRRRRAPTVSIVRLRQPSTERARNGPVLYFFQAEDGIRDYKVTGVQTCALPISIRSVGMDWDQPRSAYLSAPCGPQATADFALVRSRIQKYADAAPAFEAVAKRRERSEERRGGKECRSRGSPYHLKKKNT